VCFALHGYNDPDSHCRKRNGEFDISRKSGDGPRIDFGDIHPEDGLGRTSDASMEHNGLNAYCGEGRREENHRETV